MSLKILTVAVSEDFQNVEVLFEELSLHRIVQILNGMVPEHAPYGDYLLVDINLTAKSLTFKHLRN